MYRFVSFNFESSVPANLIYTKIFQVALHRFVWTIPVENQRHEVFCAMYGLICRVGSNLSFFASNTHLATFNSWRL